MIASTCQVLCLGHCVLIVLLKYKSLCSSEWHRCFIMSCIFINLVDIGTPSRYYHISQQNYVEDLPIHVRVRVKS